MKIVGEALHQAELIEPEVVYGIPEFRLIVYVRNRIAHGYESVDYGLLWTIVQEKLPGLEQTLTTMLSNADIDDEA